MLRSSVSDLLLFRFNLTNDLTNVAGIFCASILSTRILSLVQHRFLFAFSVDGTTKYIFGKTPLGLLQFTICIKCILDH